MVANSLRSFLQQIVDYAGLFPPAQLPLETALQNYRSYATSSLGWMLSSFICPAGSLLDAAALWRRMSTGTPLKVSALCGETRESKLMDQLDQVQQAAKDPALRVTMLEGRLPEGLQESSSDWIGRLVRQLSLRGLDQLDVFIEAPGTRADDLVPALVTAAHPGQVGFKLRCGGLATEAFPSAATIAGVLAICAERSVPFKATAGLHHPIRHRDPNIGVDSHGFVNLFTAGLLAAAGESSRELLESCLLETDGSRFEFGDKGLLWAGHSLSVHEIMELRLRQMISFGSCSFSEPVADLAELGWIQLEQDEVD